MIKRGARLLLLFLLVGLAGQHSQAWATAQQEADELKTNRDRLFGTYVAYQKSIDNIPQNARDCDVWAGLPASAQGVFLTITHRLQIAKIKVVGVGFESLLQHMDALLSIRGGRAEGGNGDSILCFFGGGPCGGEDFNRLFLSMDQEARNALMLARAEVGAAQNDPIIRDFWDLPGNTQSPKDRRWRISGDRGGPHTPFTASVESNRGRSTFGTDLSPRAQVHFYCDPSLDATCGPIIPPGASRGDDLRSVTNNPFLLEIDQDYNFCHGSSTQCTYGGRSGRDLYALNYQVNAPAGVPPIAFDYAPACPDQGGGGGDFCYTCFFGTGICILGCI